MHGMHHKEAVARLYHCVICFDIPVESEPVVHVPSALRLVLGAFWAMPICVFGYFCVTFLSWLPAETALSLSLALSHTNCTLVLTNTMHGMQECLLQALLLVWCSMSG
jgi:hypothetical protein